MKIIISVLTFLILSVLLIWFAVARPFTFSSAGQDHDIEVIHLKEQVRLISQDYYPRSSEHPEVLNKLSDYIYKELSRHSSKVKFQEYQAGGQRYRNVIAKYGPDTDRVLVVGAHYDSFSELPGADDNASGVAGLIELSRLVKDLNLDIQLQIVAYTLEEPPFYASEFMGSYVHASELKKEEIEVELMISLEMIGYFSDKAGSQKYPIAPLKYFYPTRGNFIAVVDQLNSNDALKLKKVFNRSTNVDAYSINAPRNLVGVDFSDHRNYWAFDYPAVMVTDTSFYRNASYHTPHDTYDRLDYVKMAEVINGVFHYIKGFASDSKTTVESNSS